MDAFLCTLGFNLPPIENGDHMRWKLTKNRNFDIRLFYNKLRGLVPIIFPWKSVWKVKIVLSHRAYLFVLKLQK